MNILFVGLAVVFLAGISFLGWCLFGFIQYKKQESDFKREIYYYFETGVSFEESLRKSFSQINQKYNLSLNEYTIVFVVQEISALLNKMSKENVIEIYSMFLNRYIWNTNAGKIPQGIRDEKIMYALTNLELKESKGYFVLGRDCGEDFARKYPEMPSVVQRYRQIPEWFRWVLLFPFASSFSFLSIFLVSIVDPDNFFIGPLLGMLSFVLMLHMLAPRFKNRLVVGIIILRMIVSTAVVLFIFIMGETPDKRTWFEISREIVIWAFSWYFYFGILRNEKFKGNFNN